MLKSNWLLFVLFWFCSYPIFAQNLTFESLTCNAQLNPIAIDSEQPLLSWTIDAKGFNRSQTAYHVLVASAPNLLDEKQADLWNSGKVISPQSAHVKYAGKSLNPTQKYWWKIKIWDEKGQASEWSAPNTFETGLMDEANWGKAQWISLSNDNRTSEHRFREYKTGRMDQATMVTSQPASWIF